MWTAIIAGLIAIICILKPDIIQKLIEETFKLIGRVIDFLQNTLQTILVKIVDEYIEKLSSGRYFILVSSIVTLCVINIQALDLLRLKIITDQVFFVIFAVTSNICTAIVTYYFGQSKSASMDQTDTNGAK